MPDLASIDCVTVSCPWNQLPRQRRAERLWQFLHQLAHGNGTFSASTLAYLADCPEQEAYAALRAAAADWQLVMPVQGKGLPTIYARFAKPKKTGKTKAPRKDARVAQAFGKASGTLWG